MILIRGVWSISDFFMIELRTAIKALTLYVLNVVWCSDVGHWSGENTGMESYILGGEMVGGDYLSLLFFKDVFRNGYLNDAAVVIKTTKCSKALIWVLRD